MCQKIQGFHTQGGSKQNFALQFQYSFEQKVDEKFDENSESYLFTDIVWFNTKFREKGLRNNRKVDHCKCYVVSSDWIQDWNLFCKNISSILQSLQT